jgi:hypothetical protein
MDRSIIELLNVAQQERSLAAMMFSRAGYAALNGEGSP